jgi:hypothetical protein
MKLRNVLLAAIAAAIMLVAAVPATAAPSSTYATR